MSEQEMKCCVCGKKAVMLVMEKDDPCPIHPVCNECQHCFIVVSKQRLKKPSKETKQ